MYINARVAAAQVELEQDQEGFHNFLMSRSAVPDPRVSSAVFAQNSLHRSKVGISQEVPVFCDVHCVCRYWHPKMLPIARCRLWPPHTMPPALIHSFNRLVP